MAHILAGKPVPSHLIENIPRLLSAYYTIKPDLQDPRQRVAFGTSGHRGTSFAGSFNDLHVAAIAQSIVHYRLQQNIKGPLFLGMDTHALSEAAFVSAIEVFAANKVDVFVQKGRGYTPTPVISHAILVYNHDFPKNDPRRADGVVITPSHNPPSDGGFKYNPPNGGPAGGEITKIIETHANQLINSGKIKRMPWSRAYKATHQHDYIQPYVEDLDSVVNMKAIADSGIRIGVDPLGGSGIHFWEPIADRWNLNLTIVNPEVDPTFRFMHVDKDGKIRMDCSSPWAMAGLIKLKDRFDIAFGNDPDYDRHGIVTPSGGLMNPNHYLAVAIKWLFQTRKQWPKNALIGKTLVSSSMINRVADELKRTVAEVPVGFKWFVGGLLDGSYGFGGEESAGASFLRKNGSVWTTDKDGIIMDLLAAEITAVSKRDPWLHYLDLTKRYGTPFYERIDAPATRAQKSILSSLSPEKVTATHLAQEPILAKITRAPANNAPIGGLKVVTKNGWFAARPSGTEEIYKIYAESFKSKEHLSLIHQQAQEIVSQAFKKPLS